MPKRKTEIIMPKITPITHDGSVPDVVVVVVLVVVVVVEECEASELRSSASEPLFKRTCTKSKEASLALVIGNNWMYGALVPGGAPSTKEPKSIRRYALRTVEF